MIIGKGIYLTIRRPDWFITGEIDSDVVLKNDADIHNTKSVLAKNQNEMSVSSNDEEYITDINAFPFAKSENDILDSLNGITNHSAFSKTEDRALIGNRNDGKAIILKQGNAKTDIAIVDKGEAHEYEDPMFAEIDNGTINSVSEVTPIETSKSQFELANSHNVIGKKANAFDTKDPTFSEKVSRLGASQNVQADIIKYSPSAKNIYGKTNSYLGIKDRVIGLLDDNTVPTEVTFRPSSANQKITVMFTQSESHSVRIDWGDGTPSMSIDTLAYASLSHTYSGLSTSRDYTLKIYCKSGKTWIPTTNSISTYGFVNPSAGSSSLVRSVRIGDGVTQIGNCAFAYWRQLTSVTMPDTITKIGSCAFEYSTIRTLSLPTGLTEIGHSAFHLTYQLGGTLNIPQGVTVLHASIFAGCAAKLNLPANLSKITATAFDSNGTRWSGTEITAAPNSSYRTVNNCLINGTTLIVCARTSSIPDTEGITAIRSGALMEYTDITIPASVESIDATNIAEHFGTHTMTLLPTTPPTLSGAITNTGTFTYLVPAESVEAYKTAPYWSDVASNIQPLS